MKTQFDNQSWHENFAEQEAKYGIKKQSDRDQKMTSSESFGN
jgi:hypothetical protein